MPTICFDPPGFWTARACLRRLGLRLLAHPSGWGDHSAESHLLLG